MPDRTYETILHLEGRAVPLRVRRNRRARRLILRLDAETEGAVITLPWGVPVEEAISMARRKEGWILSRLEKVPPRMPFADGVEVPILGEPHLIRHLPQARGGVWREGGVLYVTGRPEHLARRVADYLRKEARRECTERVRRTSLLLGRKPGRITLRDTRSRWGSCAANGDLSFCWRLVMAPADVLDYVIAHEVAHLRHHDHSPRFWRTVEDLVGDAKAQRAWLKRHGASLHRFGTGGKREAQTIGSSGEIGKG